MNVILFLLGILALVLKGLAKIADSFGMLTGGAFTVVAIIGIPFIGLSILSIYCKMQDRNKIKSFSELIKLIKDKTTRRVLLDDVKEINSGDKDHGVQWFLKNTKNLLVVELVGVSLLWNFVPISYPITIIICLTAGTFLLIKSFKDSFCR